MGGTGAVGCKVGGGGSPGIPGGPGGGLPGVGSSGPSGSCGPIVSQFLSGSSIV